MGRSDRKRQRALERAFAKAHRKHIKNGDAITAAREYAKIGMKMPHDPRVAFFASLATYQNAQHLPPHLSDKAMQTAISLMGKPLELALREQERTGKPIDPGIADAEYNLGKFLLDQGKDDEALVHLDRAVEMRPSFIEALQNAANCHEEMGNADIAKAYRERCLALPTHKPEAIYNRSFLRLTTGDYARGWAEYEARWACAGFRHEYQQPWMTHTPLFGGDPSSLIGKRILLFAEQGYGDTIQFARYVPFLPANEATYGLDVQPALAEYMRGVLPEHITIIPRTSPNSVPKGQYDVALSLMSLPAMFGGKLPALTKPMLEVTTPKAPHPLGALRVGVCWAGSPTHKNDRNRSIPFPTLAPLFDVPGIEWVSCQFGPREAEANGDARLILAGDRYPDFLGTARDLLPTLDLVITVDTALAHLAGAQMVPTWVLIPKIPDFRWGYERSDSPWYPSLSLYRCATWRGWEDVIARVSRDLWALTRRKAA